MAKDNPPPTVHVTYTCRSCGTVIPEYRVLVPVVPKERGIEDGLTFCSTGCVGAWSADHHRYFRNCAWCSKQFDTRTYTSGPNRQYCSARCKRQKERLYRRALRRLAKGRDAMPRLRGGETVENYQRLLDEIDGARAEIFLLWNKITGRDQHSGGPFRDDAELPDLQHPPAMYQITERLNWLNKAYGEARDSMHRLAEQGSWTRLQRQLDLLRGARLKDQTAAREEWLSVSEDIEDSELTMRDVENGVH